MDDDLEQRINRELIEMFPDLPPDVARETFVGASVALRVSLIVCWETWRDGMDKHLAKSRMMVLLAALLPDMPDVFWIFLYILIWWSIVLVVLAVGSMIVPLVW